MSSAIPEVPLSYFQKRLDLGKRRFPIEGIIETTFRCNLRCAHCYVNEPVGDFAIRDQEMSLDRLKLLVDEIVDAGTLHVLFTGGEVLVRPDFEELYLYALRKGLIITVFTNGTLVTDRIADLFDEYRPERVEISLYGMTRETYEKVTGIPGSYDKCLEGIKRLTDRKIPLMLKTMALAWNQHEVPAMEAYAHSLGLKFKFDGLLNPRVDCGANRNGELQMSPEQILALDLQNPERMKELKDFCATFIPAPEAHVDRPEIYTCGAGETSFTVDPYGKLQMCQLSRKSYFDLKQGSFDQGWNEFFPMLRARTWQTNAVCRKCNLMSLCGSCPGAAEMEHGDIEAMVASFCEIAHLRADAVMGASSGHRRDATCCLGEGRLAALPAEDAAQHLGHGCGSCSSHEATPAAPALIQIARSR
jgi:radical SAM protein with 4Fe4S-binding SPASM domain